MVEELPFDPYKKLGRALDVALRLAIKRNNSEEALRVAAFWAGFVSSSPLDDDEEEEKPPFGFVAIPADTAIVALEGQTSERHKD